MAPPKVEQARLAQAYGKLPLSFEANRGQIDPQVKYLSRGSGYTLFLTRSGALMSLRKAPGAGGTPAEPAVLRLSLLGAKPDALISGEEALEAKTHYLIGNGPARMHKDIPLYGKVRFQSAYPGVDLVYYGNQRQLEYDFVLAPGADPSVIRMGVSGAEKSEIDAQGDLVLHLGDSQVRQHKPIVYQLVNGEKRGLEGHYVIKDAPAASQSAIRNPQSEIEVEVGFEVAAYDRALPLVIDPVLVYSTFFGDKPNFPGGTSDHSGDEGGNSIAVDSDGNAYVVGFTNSIEYPVASAILVYLDPLKHPDDGPHFAPLPYHAFLTKFKPDGSGLVYSTYLGGLSGTDIGIGVAVDALKSPYIIGNTTCTDFPVKNALHTYAGGVDTFLVKLAPSGGDIAFATYLGGSGDDTCSDIALDPSGNIYVVGATTSTNFTTANPLQAANAGGSDAFITKFSGDGSVEIFSTYLGGALNDGAKGVATDASGNVYVTGFTNSTNFPIANPFQTIKGAGAGSDAFVTKLNAFGNLLVYSTYLGGDGNDQGNGIAVDSSGNAYVTGTTASSNFPTVSPTVLPVQSSNAGGNDAFVSKFNNLGTDLVFSTYLGGSGDDQGLRIRVDSRSAVYVSGTTTSLDFPVAPATNTLQPGHSGALDGFLAKFNPTGTPLVYSTYLGSGTHNFVTDAESVGITGAQLINNVATIFTNPNILQPGQQVNVALIPPNAAFDGAFQIINVSSQSFTYARVNADVPFFATDGIAFTGGVIQANKPTSVSIQGMVADNNGNAYLTGATDGAFYYTFGAFAQITGFGGGGEDFPAPHTQHFIDPFGVHFHLPSEVGVDVDDRDVVICKIGDTSPLITSPQTALGTLGINFTYTITASNGPTNFNAAGLPPGLTVNTAGGQISGVPQAIGAFKVVLSASNASGTGAQILFLNVSSSPPVIDSPLTATAHVGSVFQYSITATNEPGAFAVDNHLPTGLSLDAITGLISGAPLIEGVFDVLITASNANGSDSKTLTLTVLPAVPVISSSASAQGVVGLSFTYAITATNNPTGYDAVGLPLGLNRDTRTGIISGVPMELGFFDVLLSASNGGGAGSLRLQLTIIPPLIPVISSADVVFGTVNEPFTFTIIANNNTLSYRVVDAAVGGNPILPPGLSINDVTGVISGTPTATGAFNYFQEARNAAGAGTKALTFNIVFPLVPVITSPNKATAVVGTAFEYDIKADNHPTSFNATGLPLFLALDAMTGVISGMPAAGDEGTYIINLTASNSNPASPSAAVMLTLTVNPLQKPFITSSKDANGLVGVAFSYQIIATGNPFSYSAMTAGGLAALGLSLDSATGLISGTPTTAGTFLIDLSATNAVGTGDVKTLTLVVVTPDAPVISSPLSVFGNDGAAFTYTITVSKGTQPITFTAAPLPQGLTLTGTTIVGRPAAGITNVILTAYNAATNPAFPNGPPTLGGPPVTATLVINISPTPAVVTNNTLTAAGTVGQAFLYQITTSGTALVSVSTSQLPPGLALVGSSITGIPTAASVTLNGPVLITLTASNNVGSDSKTLALTINAATPTITSALFASGTEGVPLRYVIVGTGTQVVSFGASPLPDGLTLQGAVISGTPAADAVGLTNVTLTATNRAGADSETLVISIEPAPALITSPLAATAAVGVPFTFDITASGSGVIFSSPDLPANGLSLSGAQISGTPLSEGIFNITIVAVNDGGQDIQTLVLTVKPAPPTITSPKILSGNDGVPLTPFTLTATGAAPITFATTPLPPGLSLLNGVISGTPTQVGSFTVIVTATNAGGSDTQSLVITISTSPPKITSPLSVLASPTVPFSYTITATGTAPITFQALNLPAGLQFSGNTISGTPLGPVGPTSATLIATSTYGVDQQTLVIDVEMTPPVITNALTVNGSDGVPFSFTLTANGSPPITFTAAPLPQGLQLNAATGVISGTPTVVGTTNAALTATNSFPPPDTGKFLTINIAPSPPIITSASSITSGLGEQFSYTITATGTAPIQFSTSTLPAGLSVNANTGVISGIPTAQGTSAVTLFATSSFGSAQQALSITISTLPPLITSPLTAAGSPGTAFSYTLTASGSPVITFTVASSQLPPGLSFSNNQITGTPAVNGVYSVTLTAANTTGTDAKTLVITITNDIDGDGFPNDLEVFFNTNPADPNSTPFVPPGGGIKVLNVTSMKIKLNFKSPGTDIITAKGTIPVGANGDITGKTATIYAGGVIKQLAANSTGNDSFKVKKPNLAGDSSFSLNFKAGSFQSKLANSQLTNENVIQPRAVAVDVLIFVNNTLFKSQKILSYTARTGRAGNAKVPAR